MAFNSFGRLVKRLWAPARAAQTTQPRRPGCRLHVEYLEDRNLLSGGPGGPSQLLAPLSGSSGGPSLVTTTQTSTPGGGGSSGGPSTTGVLSTSGGTPGGSGLPN